MSNKDHFTFTTPKKAINILVAIMHHNRECGLENSRNDQFIIPFIIGPTGTGKTTLFHQAAKIFAEEVDEEVVEVYERLADKAPEEITGYPKPKEDAPVFVRLSPEKWTHPKDKIMLAFIDEFAQSNVDQQNVGRAIINERMIGDIHLPPCSTVVCASNMMDERAGTHTMPAHVKDAVMFIYVKPDPKGWCAWAARNGIDPMVISFVYLYGAEHLYNYKNDHSLMKYPSSRSWARVSSTLRMKRLDQSEKMVMTEGQVGAASSSAFWSHIEYGSKMPSPDAIIADPNGTKFNETDSNIMYMLCCALASRINLKNATAICTWMKRVKNQAFCSFLISMALERDKNLRQSKDVRDWLTGTGSRLLIG